MFDPTLMRLSRRILNPPGRVLARAGFGANAVTVIGFALGMGGAVAIALGSFAAGLGLIVLNRICDGLDGATARATQPTDFGGYLDIVLDFVFYASVVAAFGVADQQYARAAAVLLAGFMGTGSSFLATAVIAAKRGVDPAGYGPKSFFYAWGLAEGGETFVFFVIVCLWPGIFVPAAYIFASMCGLTTIQRVFAAAHLIREAKAEPR